jgi:hypothetical protein
MTDTARQPEVYRRRDGENLVDNLARHLRQSCRACSTHPAGPLAAVNRLLELREARELSDQDLADVRAAIHEACELAAAQDPSVATREAMIDRFAGAVLRP